MIIDDIINNLKSKGVDVGVKNEKIHPDELIYNGPNISNKTPQKIIKRRGPDKKPRKRKLYGIIRKDSYKIKG